MLKKEMNYYEEKFKRYKLIYSYFEKTPERISDNRSQLYRLARAIGYLGLNSSKLKVSCYSLSEKIKKELELNKEKSEISLAVGIN